MTMSRRMTATVAVACILASTVLYPLFTGSEWFYAGGGAVIAVARPARSAGCGCCPSWPAWPSACSACCST